ncbi:MAG: hypothetical protein SGJ20_21830 [Planctomycetota bacterium]|nr:hypothetical protein [Planctomycetota bacterium]
MRGKPAITLLSTLLFLLVEVAASAKTISVNPGANLPNQGTQFTLAPDEVAGVVPAKNWNNVIVAAPDSVATYPNLIVDTNGTPSGSGVNFTIHFDELSANVFGVVTNEGQTINTPDRKMMDSYADVLGPSSSNMTNGTTLQFTNLNGFGPFDLYLYNGGTIPHGDPNRVARYDLRDGTSDSAPLIISRYGRNETNPFKVPNDVFIEQSDNGTPEGSTVGNYFVVRNLNPSSGSLFIFGDAINPFGSPARGAINGLQLVSVNPAGPTGDYNGNGVVDAADYVVWRNTSGQGATPPGSGADGNANGTIDPGDYTFWRSKFGNLVPGIGSGSNLAVPEPSLLSLLIVSTVVALCAGNLRKTRIGS